MSDRARVESRPSRRVQFHHTRDTGWTLPRLCRTLPIAAEQSDLRPRPVQVAELYETFPETALAKEIPSRRLCPPHCIPTASHLRRRPAVSACRSWSSPNLR